MNPNANTSTDFNGQAQLRVVFPGTKFIPDLDPETKVPLIDDKTGNYKSGTLVVSLFESVKVSGASPSVRELSVVKKHVTLTKYWSIREEIDSLSVEQLKEYFPELTGEVTKPAVVNAPEAEVDKLKNQVEDLGKQLAEALKLLTQNKDKEVETVTQEDMDKTGKTDDKTVDKPDNKTKK